jgi:hypothetical protein
LTPFRGTVYSPAQEIAGIGNILYPSVGLRREDADIAILYLVTGVKYLRSTDDPWFSAHKISKGLDASQNEDITLYRPDNPFSPMGCTIQVFHGHRSRFRKPPADV